MSEHTCEYEGEGAVTEPLELHDLIAIGLGGIGAVFGNIGAFFSLTANEFYSSGRYRRQRNEEIRQRVEAGYELERIIERGV